MLLTTKTVILGVALLGLAGAQTKISGSQNCAKPDVAHNVQVGDSKTHVMVLTQQKCTWTKPMEMEGVATKDDLGSGVADIHGANSRDQGYDIATMTNGDKVFVRYMGTSKVKDNVPESLEGKWSFAGGTGKFKSLKGGGTYKGQGKADGTATFDIEGEYTIGK
jgi:hypothetical protein